MVSCLRTCWNTSRFFLSSAPPSFKVYRSARAMATTSRQQPPCIPPKSSASLPPLKIWNSLTRSKTVCLFPFLFLPRAQSRLLGLNANLQNYRTLYPLILKERTLPGTPAVRQFTMTPTLGARDYVSTDIRRIMKDYFGFNLKFVMNVWKKYSKQSGLFQG